MTLAIIDKLGELLAHGVNVVETRQSHIAVEVGSRRSWMNSKDLDRDIVLLELHCHDTRHRILRSLTCNVCQRMPVRTHLTWNGDVYYSSLSPDGEGCVRLYRYETYYVKWRGKIYHVDAPEKYDVLVNIINTDFALAQLE